MSTETTRVERRSITSDDGVELSYRAFGKGKTSIYFIHGWAVSGEVFDELLPLIDLEGRRLIVPDLRGSGRSGRPPSGYTLDRYVRDIWAIADRERDSIFVALGHSMGGQLVQGLLAGASARIRGAMLLCPVPATGVPLPDPLRTTFEAAARSRSEREQILRAVSRSLSDTQLARLLDDGENVRPECAGESFASWSHGTTAWRFEGVRSPVLVLSTEDPSIPPAFLREAIAMRIPGARMVHLPDAGHYPQIERPHETAAIIAAFLAAL